MLSFFITLFVNLDYFLFFLQIYSLKNQNQMMIGKYYLMEIHLMVGIGLIMIKLGMFGLLMMVLWKWIQQKEKEEIEKVMI